MLSFTTFMFHKNKNPAQAPDSSDLLSLARVWIVTFFLLV